MLIKYRYATQSRCQTEEYKEEVARRTSTKTSYRTQLIRWVVLKKIAQAGNEAATESITGPRQQYESIDEHDARSRQQHEPIDEHDEWQSVYGPEQYGQGMNDMDMNNNMGYGGTNGMGMNNNMFSGGGGY